MRRICFSGSFKSILDRQIIATFIECIVILWQQHIQTPNNHPKIKRHTHTQALQQANTNNQQLLVI